MILLPRVGLLFERETSEVSYLTVLDSDSGETFLLPLEDYVIGVMETLSLPPWEEARKAVAIAIRSRALYCQKNTPVHTGAALCNDPTCCMGFETEDFSQDNIAAASETAGQYLTYENAPAAALFHESSGRYTASAKSVYGVEIPYLTGVKNVPEGIAEAFSFGEDSLRSLLGLPHGYPLEDLFWGYDRYGRLQTLEWEGGSLSGKEVQRLLGLPSLCLEVTAQGNDLTILCHGRGDGVGMSLNGASLLAEEGKSCEKILEFYFPLLLLNS